MKKIFISAAIVTMAFSVSAQRTEGGDNLVKNGSFDEEGLEQAVPGDYTWEPMNTCRKISVLPGWEVGGGGVWNGGCEIMDDPVLDAGDGDLRAEDDINYLRFYTDTDNMWTDEWIQQKMTGLVVGTTYNLEFVFCGAPAVVGEGDGAWNQQPDTKVIIAEVDGDKLGKEIFNQNFSAEVSTDWVAASYTFTATATEMYIKFTFGNWMPGDKHSQAWLALDNIDVYDPNGSMSGINDITVEDNAPVEYYNLHGVRVANPENGLYIRRQGSKVAKVVL